MVLCGDELQMVDEGVHSHAEGIRDETGCSDMPPHRQHGSQYSCKVIPSSSNVPASHEHALGEKTKCQNRSMTITSLTIF